MQKEKASQYAERRGLRGKQGKRSLKARGPFVLFKAGRKKKN